MTRFVIDAPTLLHLVAEGIPVAPGHQLVAPAELECFAQGRCAVHPVSIRYRKLRYRSNHARN